MKTSGKHPERKAMLKAIRTGVVPFRTHLEQCETCRTLFAFLTDFPVAGMPPMIRPSEDNLASLEAVPALKVSSRSAKSLVGRVSYDSWFDRPALEIREAPIGFTRRLCLTAGEISLEIVAERRREGWDFVARAYCKQKVASGFALRVGSRRILPKAQGFYHWSSARAPRGLILNSPSLQVSFAGLTWC